MELLSNELLEAFRTTGSQERVTDPTVLAKFFTPWWGWTWYATEYDEENRIFFWYVTGIEGEWWYFSLDELVAVRGPFGLSIERDLYHVPFPASNIKGIS